MKNKKEKMKERFLKNELVCEELLTVLSLFSNKTRFRILCLLSEGDFCVKEIVEMVNLGKTSNISQQLKILTIAGILEKHRDSKMVVYHLTDKRIRDLVDYFQENYMEGDSA